MKSRINIIAGLVLLGVCTACTEDLGDVPNRFEKIYGKESSSDGKSVRFLSNGNYIIAGRTGVSAFDFTNISGALNVGQVLEYAPSIIETDAFGNQLDFRIYPLDNPELHPLWERFEPSGKGTFTDILENPDGSFFALGEWRNVPLTVGQPWNQELEAEVDNMYIFPFLARLSAERDLLDLYSFNTDPEWDTVINLISTMKRFPDGDLGVLIHLTARAENFYPHGYRILKYNDEGERVLDKRIERSVNFKFARDFCFDEEGNIVLIGQRNKSIAIFRMPLNDIDNNSERLFILDGDGIFGNTFNDNPMFIFPMDNGGFMSIYTNPRAEVVINILNSSFTSLHRFDLAPETLDEYPRAAIKTENGDFVIYTEYINPANETSTGFLYRITPEGDRIFRIPLDGIPGDVRETPDGDLLVLSNPVYNGVLPKTTLTKLSANGTFE